MPVLVERRGPVTTVVLARPQAANAVDRRTAQQLADAFRAFDGDDDARVGVLCGEGANFCGGADLKAVAFRSAPPAIRTGWSPTAMRRWARAGCCSQSP